MLNSIWNKIKDWFHHSETIFLARLEAFIGFILAVGVSLDWTQLMSLDFSNGIFNSKQVMFIGILMLAKGIITELARRRGATDL